MVINLGYGDIHVVNKPEPYYPGDESMLDTSNSTKGSESQMTSNLKLVVGRAYLRRNGTTSIIQLCDPSDQYYKYIDQDSMRYTPRGQYYTGELQTEWDLISEVTEQQSPTTNCIHMGPQGYDTRLAPGTDPARTATLVSGKKYDNGKPDLSLIPLIAQEEEAKGFMLGERKYGRYNYLAGLESHRLIAAAMRHISAWQNGEDVDAESGASHLGHARACIAMILHCEQLGTLKDTRWKK